MSFFLVFCLKENKKKQKVRFQNFIVLKKDKIKSKKETLKKFPNYYLQL